MDDSLSPSTTLSHYHKTSAPTQRHDLEGRYDTYDFQYGKFFEGVPFDAPIVDLGCGDGTVVMWLRRRRMYTDVRGVETSETQVEKAEKLGLEPGVIVVSDIITFLKASNRLYKVVVMRDVIEHMNLDYLIETFRLLSQRMLPGGRVLIQAPNALSPFFGRSLYGDLTHVRCFHPRSLKQLGDLSGFASVTVTAPAERGFRIARLVIELRFRELLRSGLRAVFSWGYSKAVALITRERDPIVTANLLAVFTVEPENKG